MYIFVLIISLSFFFVSHNIYRVLCEPYITSNLLNVLTYSGLCLLGQSYLLLLHENLNKYLEYFLYIVVYIFCFMFFYYLIIDCIRFFYTQNNQHLIDYKVLIFALLLGVYGIFNRYLIKTTEYKIYTNKNVNLRIGFITDMHIGDSGINKKILNKVVKKINEKNVDIIILGGDIVEQNAKFFIDSEIYKYFKDLKTKYGIYAVLGNHEYYGGMPYLIADTLTQYANIKVLKDEVAEFDNFKIIGREDITKNYFGNRRKIIEKIDKIEPEKYNIVVDHNPANFRDSVENKIDLQLSGHTHNGQFFPFNLIVKFFYEKPYGLLKKQDSNLITSSGLSTWKIPIKLGSKPEIVIIDIIKK